LTITLSKPVIVPTAVWVIGSYDESSSPPHAPSTDAYAATAINFQLVLLIAMPLQTFADRT